MINIDNIFFQERLSILCQKIGLEYDKCFLFKETIGGTNTTFFVQCSNDRFVFRIASRDNKSLGVDRKFEMESTSIASKNGVGFSLLHFDIESGDMITRYIEGHTPSNDEVKDEKYINIIAELFRNFHSFSVNRYFDPFEDITIRTTIIQEYSELSHFEPYKKAIALYDTIKCSDFFNQKQYLGLCHNDANNYNIYISTDNRVYLIDYEYSGMGNVFFDIACLCGSWDYDLKKIFLTKYFKEYSEHYMKCLDYYYLLSLVWNGTWAYIKSLDDNFIEIDYVTWANEQFNLAVDYAHKMGL